MKCSLAGFGFYGSCSDCRVSQGSTGLLLGVMRAALPRGRVLHLGSCWGMAGGGMCLGMSSRPGIITENKVLSVSNCLGIKNQLTVNVRVYFWTLEFCHARPQTSAALSPFSRLFPIRGPAFACESLDQLVNFYKAAAGVFTGPRWPIAS